MHTKMSKGQAYFLVCYPHKSVYSSPIELKRCHTLLLFTYVVFLCRFKAIKTVCYLGTKLWLVCLSGAGGENVPGPAGELQLADILAVGRELVD